MKTLSSLCAVRLLQSADEFRARLAGEFSSVHGISLNEFFMLMHLSKAENRRLSRAELAKRMHVSASTVTRMVAPMEKIGLVKREVDERDARIAFVAITDAGHTKQEETRVTFEKRAGYFFQDRWSEEDLTELSTLLYRLTSRSISNLS